jgi:hypothetical protein
MRWASKPHLRDLGPRIEKGEGKANADSLKASIESGEVHVCSISKWRVRRFQAGPPDVCDLAGKTHRGVTGQATAERYLWPAGGAAGFLSGGHRGVRGRERGDAYRSHDRICRDVVTAREKDLWRRRPDRLLEGSPARRRQVQILAKTPNPGPGPYGSYRFELYHPGTTDNTFPQAPPVMGVGTPGSSTSAVIVLQAPYNGTFLLAVCQNVSGDCRSVDSGGGTYPMGAYTFTPTLVAAGIRS